MSAEINAFFNRKKSEAIQIYEEGMKKSVECLGGIQTFAQKTHNLIMMDSEQILLAEELKSSKMHIEDEREMSLAILKRKVHASPWFVGEGNKSFF